MGYQGWNNRRGGMSNGGAIHSNTPLTADQLFENVPSIFADTAHESRSDRFKPIATIDVLRGLEREGFEPFFAQQQRTRDVSKREFTKHVLRLRHRNYVNAAGDSFEIILLNANDGSAGYKMLPGFFRFVCMNGLFLGDAFDPVKVRHTGKAIEQVIEGAFRVLDLAPRAAEMVDRFKSIQVDDEAAHGFADSVHRLRFPSAWEETENGPQLIANSAPATPSDMLRPRRSADTGGDLWTVFNRVQENAIRGGFSGRVASESSRRGYRNARMKAVNGIAQNANLNQGIADRATRLANFLESEAA